MSGSKPTLDDLRIERRSDTGSSARVWLGAVIVLVLSLAGAGAWWWNKPKAIEVRTAPAMDAGGTGGDRTVLNASGYVTARRLATVSSKVTGKVVEVLVEEGLRVQAGQVLARIDDTNVKASLRLGEAQLDSARRGLDETRARLAQAELEFGRSVELTKSGIASKADFDRAEADAKALRARLEQQQAEVTVADRQVALWQQQLDDTIIRAPFPGVVTSKNAQPGEMISPMSSGGFTRTGICTIVDMDSLEIEIDVNESYINRVETGQAVEAALDAYPEWKIPCKVIAIIPAADRQKATVKVRVGFNKLDPRILPDMGVKVAFREASGSGAVASRNVTVPKNAVRRLDGRDVVFLVKDGRAERRAVTVVRAGASDADLSAGVTAGEKVIVDSPVGLEEGARVKEAKP